MRGAQRTALSLEVGGSHFDAEVMVTPAGLLAIGALVSSILLASAVIVRAARASR
ncbi:hypothetical protein SAMN06297144_1331 [Sphingomonas guangdongensis]|uniref:Uncharacterized protein n=1 Tax=Sphingomonas guangdongensis TaxID=1141890 RepID=A0A285QGK5_9SPHN|nr:hypothetical protein [Sphingomonas guangdongensis]SOB80976.1 hypothetical protein SAMN06297144_1331 [Sphingomonas guangdongensis]